MMMLMGLGQKSVSWDEPVEMLLACHGKIRQFCKQLALLPDYVREHGSDETARQTVARIVRYFEVAAPLHHDDEEQDFFPLLGLHAPETAAQTAELLRQHKHMHQCWLVLHENLRGWENGTNAEISKQAVADFIDAYARHMELEEPLFHIGAARIPEDLLKAAGARMAARRKA